jgi:uncharacterized membrane protein YphA (DoxX/SURF4 family)
MLIRKPSKTLHILLLVTQLALSLTLIWASYMKLFQSPELLSAMWPWTGELPAAFVKFTGIIDFVAGIGIVLPTLVNIRPRLTFAAAAGIVMLMLSAMVFHISRGEPALFNIIFGVLAAFVAWGRYGNAVSR